MFIISLFFFFPFIFFFIFLYFFLIFSRVPYLHSRRRARPPPDPLATSNRVAPKASRRPPTSRCSDPAAPELPAASHLVALRSAASQLPSPI
jgi:hypothetical protein